MAQDLYIPDETLPERIPDPRKREAIKGMALHGTKSAAARFAKVSRATITKWWDEDPAFAVEITEAYEEHCDNSEEELHRRAVVGDEVPVFLKGEPVPKRDPFTGEPVLDDDFNVVYQTRVVKSDALLVPYLKAKRAAYREKTDLTLMGPDGGPVKTDSNVTINLVRPSPIDLEAREREFLAAKKAQEAGDEEK